MKKSIKLLALIMALLMVLCGCAKRTTSDGFDYSNGLNKNGYWDGIKASDYVTLCDISKIEIAASDIDAEVEYLLETYSKEIQNTTRAIVDKDTVNIDYVGYMDGEAFDGGSTEGQGTTVQIGVTSYIDNFLEQLIGHKAGDEFDINVTFPDSYPNNPDLAGKPAVFKTTVNYVVDYEKSELNDEFVATNLTDSYGWTTVAEMRKGIAAALAMDYVYDNSEFKDEMPEIVKTQIVESSVENLKAQASQYSLDVDTFISYVYGSYGFSSLEDLKSYLELNANIQAKDYMLYQAIAEKKNINVSLKEMNAYYKENNLDADQVLDYYGKGYITSRVLYDKVADYISSVTVEK